MSSREFAYKPPYFRNYLQSLEWQKPRIEEIPCLQGNRAEQGTGAPVTQLARAKALYDPRDLAAQAMVASITTRTKANCGQGAYQSPKEFLVDVFAGFLLMPTLR